MKTNDHKNISGACKKIAASILLAILIVNAGLVSTIAAQCGYSSQIPDYTFDYDGQVTTDLANQTLDHGVDIAVQPDGKSVVAARSYSTGWDFAIARYNVNGSLDASFGSDGVAIIDFSDRVDSVSGIALQPNGKILVAGSTCILNDNSSCNFALARLNTNGSRDITFGALGKITTDFAGALDQGAKVLVQSNGKIVVAGRTLISAGNIGYAFARYSLYGILDTTFGGDGMAVFSMGNYGVNDMAIQPDGKIIAVGSGNLDFTALRVNTDGTRDGSFGVRGKVSVDFGGNDIAHSVALQSNGKLLWEALRSHRSEGLTIPHSLD